MNENENNFESLRRLLALKRHETPPPGYFNNFSTLVLTRIRAGESQAAANLLEELFDQAPWLAKVFQVFEMKPAFAGTFASALCLLLLFGIVYAERPDAASQMLVQAAITTTPLPLDASPTELAQVTDQMGIVSSTNPVFNLQPAASDPSFGQSPFGVQPVNFSLPGN